MITHFIHDLTAAETEATERARSEEASAKEAWERARQNVLDVMDQVRDNHVPKERRSKIVFRITDDARHGMEDDRYW